MKIILLKITLHKRGLSGDDPGHCDSRTVIVVLKPPLSPLNVDRVSNPDLPCGDGRITIVKSGETDVIVTGWAVVKDSVMADYYFKVKFGGLNLHNYSLKATQNA